jgi:plasmid replication initiation protein
MAPGNEKKLNKELPVIMGKDLAQARFSMTLWERRIMYVCMSKLSADDVVFHEITFSLVEMAKLLDESSFSNTDNESIKEAARNLTHRVVEINEKGRFEIYPWLSYFKLEQTKAGNMISMEFNGRLAPHLLYLLENRGYTKFLLKYALPLGSAYAQRCYEMFRALIYEAQPRAIQTIDLMEFRRKLDIADEKYAKFGMFKKRVLETAERDINQKTDIFIKFTEIKGRGKGGRIESLHVSVILKTHMVHEFDRFLVWQKDDLLDKLQSVVQAKKGQQINTKAL